MKGSVYELCANLSRGLLTAVKSHHGAACDHHQVRLAHSGQAHKQASSNGQHIHHQHALHPAEAHPSQHSLRLAAVIGRPETTAVLPGEPLANAMSKTFATP